MRRGKIVRGARWRATLLGFCKVARLTGRGALVGGGATTRVLRVVPAYGGPYRRSTMLATSSRQHAACLERWEGPVRGALCILSLALLRGARRRAHGDPWVLASATQTAALASDAEHVGARRSVNAPSSAELRRCQGCGGGGRCAGGGR